MHGNAVDGRGQRHPPFQSPGLAQWRKALRMGVPMRCRPLGGSPEQARRLQLLGDLVDRCAHV
ncbi:MAG TPA: hypothetical protein PKZ73_04320, partial [Methanomassiliicoccales archaeon]|nr:hypothetical protein [Methanomassiliicoccales archaeon]